jgi:hypothetical protein
LSIDSPPDFRVVIFTLFMYKVKFTLEQAMKVQRRSRDIAVLFLTLSLDVGGGFDQCHTPAVLPRPGKRSGTHCTGGWVGIKAGLDGCGKSCPLLGFDPQTTQPIASHFTDYAVLAHLYI